MLKNKVLVAENDVTEYYTIIGEEGDKVGLFVNQKGNADENCTVENFFFTVEEARRCSEWLAEKEVDAALIRDVLTDTYYAY